VWLPSVTSSSDEADTFYAGCVKAALGRLSTEEVRQYFPLFIFQERDEKFPQPDSMMIPMPMSAPAAVPDEEGEGEVVAPKDSCEMMLCTTKQKKRKGVSTFCLGEGGSQCRSYTGGVSAAGTIAHRDGMQVPYCGTCRKFMEETVKWYCDTYHRHPAKEKDVFVPAVRNERCVCCHPY
jgi:hypothetical protein